MTLMVSTEDPVAGLGLKEPVMPLGQFRVERVTGPLKPPAGVMEMLEVVEVPETTVAGDPDSVKLPPGELVTAIEPTWRKAEFVTALLPTLVAQFANGDGFMVREAISIDDAIRMADAANQGVVVLSDTGDTVFGGTAGDSNLILEAILRLGIKGRALIPLIEPATVATLVAAGEGATVTLALGGSSTGFFAPITITGVVRKIADGHVKVAVFQQPEFDQGRTVIFETGPVTMLISEHSGAAGNVPDVYRAFGIEPADFKMAVLKTASNFQFFKSITSQVIRVDTSGPGQSDVVGLPWRRVPRPIFPMDAISGWRG